VHLPVPEDKVGTVHRPVANPPPSPVIKFVIDDLFISFIVFLFQDVDKNNQNKDCRLHHAAGGDEEEKRRRRWVASLRAGSSTITALRIGGAKTNSPNH
jgi:hypothetical protein